MALHPVRKPAQKRANPASAKQRPKKTTPNARTTTARPATRPTGQTARPTLRPTVPRPPVFPGLRRPLPRPRFPFLR